MDGTDDSSFVFWSPDGQFLGFFAQGKLKKIALAGGPPQNICTTTPVSALHGVPRRNRV